MGIVCPRKVHGRTGKWGEVMEHLPHLDFCCEAWADARSVGLIKCVEHFENDGTSPFILDTLRDHAIEYCPFCGSDKERDGDDDES